MSSYLVSLPPNVSPGNYVIGDGGILVRVKEDDDQRVIQPQQLLACGRCMATFTAKDALARHLARCKSMKKEKKKPRKRTEESAGLSSDEEVSEQEVACPREGCLHRFTPSDLERHVPCHVESNEDGNSFACPQCGAEFAKWRPLSAHLWKSHSVSVGLASCPVCREFKALTPSALREHLLIHSEDRKFKCSVCGRSFKQMSQLTNHVVASHLKKKRAGGSAAGAATVDLPAWCSKKKCDLCQKYFSDSKCLKKHVQAVHGKLKPYICQVCNHQSSRKAMLEMHVRQHTGEKPYRCNGDDGACDYRTADHNSLRRHKMRHSGTRPYRCPFCEYSSIQASTFKNHVASRHAGEEAAAAATAATAAAGTRSVYACRECSFKTVNRETYFGHLGNHRRQQKNSEEILDKDAMRDESDPIIDPSKHVSPPSPEKLDECSPPSNLEKRPAILKTSRRESTSGEGQKDASISAANTSTAVKVTQKVFEEEDSLHGATTDLGGTTIPA